jgi:MFS family permease
LDNAGAVVGPLLAAGLLASGMALRDVFLWTLVPALLCVALTGMLQEPPTKRASPKIPTFGVGLSGMPPALRRYLVVAALFTLGNSSNMFLLLRASELGVPQVHIPLLWAAVSAIAMLFSAPLSAASDKWGRRNLLVAGYVAYAVFYTAMALWRLHGMALYALFAFYGLFLAATEGVEKALVADLAPAGLQGTAFGWFNMTTGFMLLPASWVFGWLYQAVSGSTAFLFSAACAASATALLACWVGDSHSAAQNVR